MTVIVMITAAAEYDDYDDDDSAVMRVTKPPPFGNSFISKQTRTHLERSLATLDIFFVTENIFAGKF